MHARCMCARPLQDVEEQLFADKERKADLEAGVLSPGDAAARADTGSDEFKDRLRSTLASFSRPRAQAPPPGGGPSDPPSDGEAK